MIGLCFNLAWGRSIWLSSMERAFPSASADNAPFRCKLCDWAALADPQSGDYNEMAKGQLKSPNPVQVRV